MNNSLIEQLKTLSDNQLYNPNMIEQLTDPDDFFIFANETKRNQWEEVITYLSSPMTWSLNDQKDWQLIAQTIDGDNILSKQHQSLIIPKSLILKDIECYLLSYKDLFIAYFTQSLGSKILPVYT